MIMNQSLYIRKKIPSHHLIAVLLLKWYIKNPPTHPIQVNQATRSLPRTPIASPSQNGIRTINTFDPIAQNNVRTSYSNPFDTSENAYTQNNIRTYHPFDTLGYPNGTGRVNKIKRTNTYSHFPGK